MLNQAIQRKWSQSIRNLLVGVQKTTPKHDCQRLTITEQEAYTLPRSTRRIRVLQGGAWVSHLREDMVICAGETLTLLPDREGVVITAVGRQPVELEIYT